MSDMSLQNKGPGGSGGRQSSKTGSLADQAGSLARDVKEQASTLAEQATSQVKDQVAGLTEGAKEAAASAGEKLRSAVEQQKNVGAEYVSGVAGAIRQAAEGFDDQLPQAAGYIRQAAEQVESLSDALQRRDLNELVDSLQTFARRQPTAFLGATFLAGFAAMRFLKSGMPSGSGQHHDNQHAGQGSGQQYRAPGQYGGQGRGQEFGRSAEDLRVSTSSPSVVPDRAGM